jgi:glutathione S-transferase
MKFYDYLPSQNGWKIRSLAALLDLRLPTEYVPIFAGAARAPAFLACNPMGAVPVLELDDGRCIAESNAILCFLAEGTAMLPSAAAERAGVLQWLFFEQNYVEPVIGSLRYWRLTGKLPRRDPAVVDDKRRGGERALAALDRHLARQDFLANGRFGLADLSLYAYTHLAGDAGLALDAYPCLQRWIARVAAAGPWPPVVGYEVDPLACGELG